MKKPPSLFESKQITEAVKETGHTLREIIARLSGQPIFLFGVASMILALVSLVLTSLVPSNTPLSWFPYGLLIFGLILVLVAAFRGQSSQIESTKDYNKPRLSYAEPTNVSVSDPHSVAPMPSQILKMPKGGISIWVYVNPFNQGIRNLKNNRYIISHDTNYGKEKSVDGENRYINVFSLSRGPHQFHPPSNPEWKLWITNDKGKSWWASYIDSRDLSPGWHHFLVRWNHGKPSIELLIDGIIVINKSDYFECWPAEYSNSLLIGTWTNRLEEHSVETYLWRVQAIYDYPNESWIGEELKNVPPITY